MLRCELVGVFSSVSPLLDFLFPPLMYKMTHTDLMLGAYRVINSDRVLICGLAFVFNLVQAGAELGFEHSGGRANRQQPCMSKCIHATKMYITHK